MTSVPSIPLTQPASQVETYASSGKKVRKPRCNNCYWEYTKCEDERPCGPCVKLNIPCSERDLSKIRPVAKRITKRKHDKIVEELMKKIRENDNLLNKPTNMEQQETIDRQRSNEATHLMQQSQMAQQQFQIAQQQFQIAQQKTLVAQQEALVEQLQAQITQLQFSEAQRQSEKEALNATSNQLQAQITQLQFNEAQRQSEREDLNATNNQLQAQIAQLENEEAFYRGQLKSLNAETEYSEQSF